jgi:hypothetical protein
MMEGKETLDRVGLDAYMLLRVIRLCTRMTLFTSILGCAVLVPVFAQGTEGLTSFNMLTLNNVTNTETLWFSTVMAVVFTFHAFFLMRHEYQNYVAWRIHWLAQGTVDDPRFQSRYTVRLEGVPAHLQTNMALEQFVDKVFPSQVYSANVQLGMTMIYLVARFLSHFLPVWQNRAIVALYFLIRCVGARDAAHPSALRGGPS